MLSVMPEQIRNTENCRIKIVSAEFFFITILYLVQVKSET